jgi:hypothetical protein
MPMRLVVLLSSVALVAAAGAQATPRTGTLTGVVTRGPIVPVCAVEQPCEEPAKNVTLLFSHDGAVVARVVTDGQGRYRRRLPAGSYAVRRPAAATFDRKLEPNRVKVFPGRVRNVDFSIDTGIR